MQEVLGSRDCSLDEFPPGIKLDSVTKGEGEKGYQVATRSLCPSIHLTGDKFLIFLFVKWKVLPHKVGYEDQMRSCK